MEYLTTLFVAIVMVTCVKGHGRMVIPPSRAAMWRFGFHTPVNNDDHGLDCGGQGITWDGTNTDDRGHCGVCGDPYNANIKKYEAGGRFATGKIVRQYSEGQVIDIELDIMVTHGGWSEFRICPNNDVNRVVSQECLDQHLLLTLGGKTRFYHPVGQHKVTLKLVLPTGLTCTQCVLQWWWKTNANNNCQPSTGKDCCIGCGRQEIFVNCADVAISSRNPGIPVPTNPTPVNPQTLAPFPVNPQTLAPFPVNPQTHAPFPVNPQTLAPFPVNPQTEVPHVVPTTVNTLLPNNFIPVKNTGPVSGNTGAIFTAGFVPIDVGPPKCKATDIGRRMYGANIADRWCQAQCNRGICPKSLCNDSCRV